jgi:hypothetical protein
LRAAAIVTFCAGLVSVPNMLYFSGPKYSNKQEGVYWALKGSVSFYILRVLGPSMKIHSQPYQFVGDLYRFKIRALCQLH